MMDTTISNFHTGLYIQTIHKLTFHIPRVQKLGTNFCGEFCRTLFKHRESFQDVLCLREFTERVFASFDHKIQP